VTSDRAQAYGRVTRTLEDLGATKLLASEQERLREAADTLLFCDDVGADPAARAALEDIDALAAHLVASDRWTSERAERLLADVAACGPLSAVA
jgi:hypothetical protein